MGATALTIMSLAEKETGHALNFYLVFLSERVCRVIEHKSNLNHRYQKSTISSINSQTWVNLQTQIALNEREDEFSWGRIPLHPPPNLNCWPFSKSFLKEAYDLYQVTMYGEKEKLVLYEDYWMLALNWYWFQKSHRSLGPPVRGEGLMKVRWTMFF